MDDNAFIKMFDPFVKTFAYKYVRRECDKQDFEQELRIRLWQAYKSHYDPKKGKLSTWVYQTLQLHARKLRFDILKQHVFEQEMLGSEFFHNQYYHQDEYFLNIAAEIVSKKLEDESKYLELEKRIQLDLNGDERLLLNLILKSSPNKVNRIGKDLSWKKKKTDNVYKSLKAKVTQIYETIYCI